VHETTWWTTSVCTGAMILAAAGIIDGLPATTHWMDPSELRAVPTIAWQRAPQVPLAEGVGKNGTAVAVGGSV
jgi:putative intracellular protease/amidase